MPGNRGLEWLIRALAPDLDEDHNACGGKLLVKKKRKGSNLKTQKEGLPKRNAVKQEKEEAGQKSKRERLRKKISENTKSIQKIGEGHSKGVEDGQGSDQEGEALRRSRYRREGLFGRKRKVKGGGPHWEARRRKWSEKRENLEEKESVFNSDGEDKEE